MKPRLVGAYHYLDLVPKGRDEAELPWPMACARRHDRYGLEPREGNLLKGSDDPRGSGEEH
jgi:hypothetical protein